MSLQKITPFIWFDDKANEAIDFYTSLFNNSRVVSITEYPKESKVEHMKEMEGKVLTGVFELEGQRFMGLDGGPQFKPTPAISFTVACATEEEIDRLWDRLSDGGSVLMEFQEYPFSKKYGWLNDKYGVSWQLSLGESAQKITPSLLFVGQVHGKAQEAMKFYTSIFENSSVNTSVPYEEGEDMAGTIKYAEFTLSGQNFIAMDGGLSHDFTFTEGFSFYVECQDQEEVNVLWNKLTADGGKESMCGWLKDKYGVSWQIIPKQMEKFMSDPDTDKSKRAMDALLQMKRIDIAKLQEAYDSR